MVSVIQLAESWVKVYFPSKAILSNMSHFNDTWDSKMEQSFFVWLLARVAGDFWAAHWQCFTQLKATVLSFCPQEESKLQKQHLHVPLCEKHTTQKGEKIVHLVSLYIYRQQWMYQLEWVSSFSEKLSVDKLICHESYTGCPTTNKISTATAILRNNPVTVVLPLQCTAIVR